MSVNPDKTELLLTRKRRLPGFFEPHFFGVTLHHFMSVKYIGVVLDFQLSWREHVDVKVKKAHNLLWAYRRAYDVDVGPEAQGSLMAPSFDHLSHFHL